MTLPSDGTRVVQPSDDFFAWLRARKVKKNGSKTVKKATADKFDRSWGGGPEVEIFGRVDIMGPEAPEVLTRIIGGEAAIVSVNPTDCTVN
jgi:hypothetical protein